MMPDAGIRVDCAYCGNVLCAGETVCPACQEDLSALVKLAYQHVILYNEGVMLARRGQALAARERLLASIALAPDFAPAQRVVAKLYAQTENWEQALDAAQCACDLEPDDERNGALYEAIVEHLPTAAVQAEPDVPQRKRHWWDKN